MGVHRRQWMVRPGSPRAQRRARGQGSRDRIADPNYQCSDHSSGGSAMIALKTTLLALVLQATAPVVPSQQQAPTATVSGVVVNANGEPVPNIKVTMGKLGVNLGPLTQFILGER